MHSPQYTQKIKDLLAARKDVDDALNRCVYAFRNGRKPDSIQLEIAKQAFTEALTILEDKAKD